IHLRWLVAQPQVPHDLAPTRLDEGSTGRNATKRLVRWTAVVMTTVMLMMVVMVVMFVILVVSMMIVMIVMIMMMPV
ncbi:hypothetical protein V1525DRAFT_392274, partial [Lipomyces kononenkoae]